MIWIIFTDNFRATYSLKKKNIQRFCYRPDWEEQEQTLRVSRISFPEDEFLRDCEKVWDGLVNLSVGAPLGMNGWVSGGGGKSGLSKFLLVCPFCGSLKTRNRDLHTYNIVQLYIYSIELAN
jgi:hypothetical protein